MKNLGKRGNKIQKNNCIFNIRNEYCQLFDKPLDKGKRLQECIDYRRGYNQEVADKLNKLVKEGKLTGKF